MKEAENYLKSILNKNDTIVVGCSGGPDSMCLLHVLNNLKKEYNLKLICAHVNHNIRKESFDEKEFVENFAVSNNIIFEYYLIDNYKNNKFTEEEGRRKRYAFFEELMNKYNANYLMTAHHGDDLIETVLMRIVRGSNLKGYKGISIKNGKLIRPLLNVTKEDIINYLNTNNIKYCIDNTNSLEEHTRNRFRKHMLPFLKKEDEKVHLKFLKFSQELEKYENYVNKIINNKYKEIVNNNVVDINKLLIEDDFIIEKIIEKVIENIQKTNIFNISNSQLNNIINLVKDNKNKKINLSDGFVARVSYNKLYIEKDIETDEYFYIFSKKQKVNNFMFEEVDENEDKSNYTLRLNSEEIELPLVIRTKKDGDRIEVKNLNGSKKVSDIFIDSKIESIKRDTYPIVTDSKNSILWIPGLKKSIFDKKISEKYDIIIKCVEEKNEK